MYKTNDARAQPTPHCAHNALPSNGQIPHGNRCDCLHLAAAVGDGPEAISFSYCLNVLQKRWLMTCRHGEVMAAPPEKKASEKWRDYGELVGPVKALLIKNG